LNSKTPGDFRREPLLRLSSPSTRRTIQTPYYHSLTLANRGPESRTLHVLPTVWFRNTWVWGAILTKGARVKPRISQLDGTIVHTRRGAPQMIAAQLFRRDLVTNHHQVISEYSYISRRWRFKRDRSVTRQIFFSQELILLRMAALLY